MKIIRNPLVFTGAVLLGTAIAACSSKSNDDGTGGAGTGSNGGVSNTGGAATGTTKNTGGNATTTATGGQPTVSLGTGGTPAFNQATYCNGIFQGQTCSQTQVEADVRTVNMLIVLDESGSMNDAPTAGAASKWTIMKQALQSALSGTAENINYGLLLFPYMAGGISATSNNPAEVCAVPDVVADAVNVPIGKGVAAFQAVIAKVNSQTASGGTPTSRALKQAYNYFVTGDGRTLSGSKWVLLATDGGPNCNLATTSCTEDKCTINIDGKCSGTNANCCTGTSSFACLDDLAATSQIQQLATAGVKTFVVGVPGTAAYANSLNSFANAGQVPNTSGLNGETYYAISATAAQQDLVEAFGKITTQLIKSCDIPLKADPPNAKQVSVAIDCALQPSLDAAPAPDSGVNGFYVDYTQHPAHIKLVGAPCDSITTQGAHNVDVIVGCQVIN